MMMMMLMLMMMRMAMRMAIVMMNHEKNYNHPDIMMVVLCCEQWEKLSILMLIALIMMTINI